MNGMDSARNPSVTLVGASTRAMAWSATRAGERPLCLDLFTDTDLLALPGVITQRLKDWPPEGLERLLPPGIPWAYGGGLENHPGLLAKCASRAPLWGNQGRALREARFPKRWQRRLRGAGESVPDLAVRPPAGEETAWMLKPYQSAGGRGVRHWPVNETVSPWRCFAQRRVEGLNASAVYAVGAGEAEWLGVTEQWVGQPWLHARGFGYCGSVGPLGTSPAIQAQLKRLGGALVGMGLRGLVGVDLMLHDDHAWVIEINPRWPASVEVLERARGFSAWDWHRWGCDGGGRPKPFASTGPTVAKAILFAPVDLEFPEGWPVDGEAWADVPAAGESIQAGSPVLTCLASAPADGLCRGLIVERVHLALGLLGLGGRIGD